MNNHMFDLIMLAVMIPTALILFFYEYPKKWKERKLIYGVRNREEYKNLGTAEKVDEITGNCRRQAGIILIISFIIMGLLCLIPDFTVRMVAWTLFVMVDIVILVIPFAKGNIEMKNLKKEIGINTQGISYSEFTNAGSVHALKLSSLIIPNIVGTVIWIAALLFDLGLYKIFGRATDGNFAVSGMMASFLIIGYAFIPVGIMFDRFRNEVISDDSDINANFNRAKKKNWADTNTFLVWINTAFIAFTFGAMIFFDSEKTYLSTIIIYMVLLLLGIGLFVKRNLAIEKRYRKETSIEIDDDDYWILGSIYYNPNDKRLNVEKRAGVGGTINFAHPIGKVIGVFTVLAVLISFVVIIWAAVLSKTPISLKYEDGKIICHQMSDDYVIPHESVEEIIMLSGTRDLKMARVSGYSMDPVYKGNFTVEGKRGCKVFLNCDVDIYIRLTSNGKTYYINGGTAEETENVYQNFIK